MPHLVSKLTLLAAVLMAITLIVHVFAGGQGVYAPLLAETDVPGLQAFISVLWHFVTVALAVLTVGLAHLARHPNIALEATLSALQLGLAVLFIAYGLAQLGTVWPMPQWTVFLLVPALTRWGQARPAARILA
jgi:hypothetical protein